MLTKMVIDKTLEIADTLAKNISLKDLSKELTPPIWLSIAHYQKFDGPLCQLNEGLENLTEVKENQELGRRHNGEPFTAPFDGYVVFPKYVERDEKGAAIQTPPKDIIALTKVII